MVQEGMLFVFLEVQRQMYSAEVKSLIGSLYDGPPFEDIKIGEGIIEEDEDNGGFIEDGEDGDDDNDGDRRVRQKYLSEQLEDGDDEQPAKARDEDQKKRKLKASADVRRKMQLDGNLSRD